MQKVNPKALKHLRNKKHWSLEELSKRAKIGKRRLIELEKETAGFHEMRDGNFADLCKALNATPAQLRGEEAFTESLPANYVTLRSKITTEAQMNYDLISAQYGVESDQIVQLAPLMFAILVEDSFKWRREQLELRKQILELQEKLRETVYADEVNGPYTISLSDVLSHEEEAIDRREVFTAPLEATNLMLRYEEVLGESFFGSFQGLAAHRITDRFTDFIAEKLKSNSHAFRADVADIEVSCQRQIFDHGLRYISVLDLFEYVTDGGDEQATAMNRLALLTGALRLRDADPETVQGPYALRAWFAEQLSDENVQSRLKEVAPAVLQREPTSNDEQEGLSLDEHGYPIIRVKAYGLGAPADEAKNNDKGEEKNASA